MIIEYIILKFALRNKGVFTKSGSAVRVKDPFRVQGRPVNFIVTDCIKFTDTVSDSTLHLTFKKLQLVKFGYTIR